MCINVSNCFNFILTGLIENVFINLPPLINILGTKFISMGEIHRLYFMYVTGSLNEIQGQHHWQR